MDYKSSDYPRYFYNTYVCKPELEIQINLKDKKYKNSEKMVWMVLFFKHFPWTAVNPLLPLCILLSNRNIGEATEPKA